MNLPVLLGYSFGKKRWSFGLEAGPVFRFQRRNMGTWVVPHTGFAPPPDATISATPPGISSNEYISLTEYYQNWKTDLHLGLTARYAITGRFGVSFGAQYRQMLRKVNHDPSYGHRIILPGMNLGVNYRF